MSRTRRPLLALTALECRTVPTAAGFNDAAGINADPTADSPYKLNDTVVGRGTGEPGWAEPWLRGVGFDGSALVQSAVTFEGDGALRVANNTNSISRDWAPVSTAGPVTVSQMVYFPPDGGVQQYLQGDGANEVSATTAQWHAVPNSNFFVLDSGVFEDTGIPVPENAWTRVDVFVDMTSRTYEFAVNGVKYTAPDPLGFRGDTPNLHRVVYLLEHPAGYYLDALRVTFEPTAVPDQYTVAEDIELDVDAPGVLGNDENLSGSAQAVLVTGPAHAAAFALNPDGSFTYTPALNYHGADSFEYRIVDGTVATDPVTVDLTVTPVNDPPVAGDDHAQLPYVSPFVLSAPGLRANDLDVDGDATQITNVTQPAVGTVTVNPDGSFSYVFPEDLVGSVTFTYQLADAAGPGNTATVTLTREVLIHVAGGTAKVIASAGADVVRVRPAGPGVELEMHTPLGYTRQVVRPPAGTRRLTAVDLVLGPGSDRLDATALRIPVRVVGGPGDDVLRTGRGHDRVYGDAVDGTGTGVDFIETGPGNDTVTAGSGGSYIDAGAGHDEVTVAGGANWVRGGAGNDVLLGGTGADLLQGEGGKDLLAGGGGPDRLDGGAGADILFDGTVAVVNPTTDSLSKVLAEFAPTRRPVLVNLSVRLVVTPGIGATDTLFGGAGKDWFWSVDVLDVLDLFGTEPRNAVT